MFPASSCRWNLPIRVTSERYKPCTVICRSRKDQKTSRFPAIPQKTIAPGDSYAGVPQLIRLLRLVGDLPSLPRVSKPMERSASGSTGGRGHWGEFSTPAWPCRRTGRQSRRKPWADLNVPLRNRIRQMQLTLERWRWLPVSYIRSRPSSRTSRSFTCALMTKTSKSLCR